ncbi:MAG: carotenoid biosynthesis protein [Ardenticatenaceae bacterium]|nr:carotenoid biosynthesis protein [Ardenticatenaceae bacterium]
MLTTLKIQFERINFFTWPSLLITGWVVTMISIPIVRWTWGDAAKLPFINAGVLLQAAAVLVILVEAWGWQRAMKTAVFIALFTFSAEALGSTTGVPFGEYSYTDVLQPQLLGVPLLIPAAWLMMLPPAWATVAFLTQKPKWRGLPSPILFIILSALALTVWDLLLDPQMVNWNLWVWQEAGGYFGIPWQNFWGWFLTAALLTAIIRPKALPIRPLLVIYTITCFLEVVGLALFWGMPGPALAGGLGMMVFVYIGWRGTAAS